MSPQSKLKQFLTMKIYLAGKIAPHDWRDTILKPGTMDAARDYLIRKDWPIVQNAVFGQHDYVGPFFLRGTDAPHDAGFHGPDSHGVDASAVRDRNGQFDDWWEDDKDDPRGYFPNDVTRLCMRSIDHADAVFAWIDRLDAYGTIAEIGYAHARNKLILIGGTEKLRDLWFVYGLATDRMIHRTAKPAGVLSEWFGELRHKTMLKQIDGYVYVLKSGPAYKIGRSRDVDVRIKQISPVLPFPVEVIHTIPSNNMAKAEAHFHNMFADRRLNGEWFDLTDEDVLLIRGQRDMLIDNNGSTGTALVRVT